MPEIIVVAIILSLYTGIAIGHIPGLRMNRATIALAGAAILVVIGAINEAEAIASIDIGTILLLGAMMVVNVNLRMAGFFRFVGSRTLRLARSPRMLLALVVVSSGLLSAVFLNDPVCLMLTPLVVDITQRLKRDPIPYLVGLGTAANVGSVATITGNPQNLIIGQSSGIPYLTFLLHLGPVALIGLCICWLVIVLVYRTEFRTPLPLDVPMPSIRMYTPLLSRTMLVVAALMLAFLVGAPIVTAACVAAAMLLISRLRPIKLLAVEWDLLAFFAGLFVITGAIESIGLSEQIFSVLSPIIQRGIPEFTLVTGVLSNVISNVPAVLLMRPEMADFANPQQAWLTLAMASTLSGNLTLLGSAATLIVAEVAGAMGARLSFTAYLRAGVPITILTLLAGVIWLMVVAG